MDNSQIHRNRIRGKRALRVRRKLNGTPERIRMCVNKTGKHLYVQLIDDEKSETMASTSTVSKEFKPTEFNRKNRESAKQLGLKIAELAKAKNILKAVFDRGRCKYHGVIAAVAEGAREGGLQL